MFKDEPWSSFGKRAFYVSRNQKNNIHKRKSHQSSHFSSGAAGKFGFSYPSAAIACDAGRNARPAADIDSESHFLRVVPWILNDNAREVVVKMEETIAIMNNLSRGPIICQHKTSG